jgi:hypothetical protein
LLFNELRYALVWKIFINKWVASKILH